MDTQRMMSILSFTQKGFCPFRILVSDFQAGCVVQMGKDVLCYSQDTRPLLEKNNQYLCPQLNINISNEIYQDIESVLKVILEIQDEENTGISIWPMFSKNSFIWKHKSITDEGKQIEELIERLRNTLETILFDLS